jgi:hypothetical protein
MRGVLPWLVRWTRRASTVDFCLALAALISPVQSIILHFFTFLVPIIQQPGQAGVLGRLSVVSLYMILHLKASLPRAK